MRIVVEKVGACGGTWTATSPDLPNLVLIEETLSEICEELPHMVEKLEELNAKDTGNE